MKVRQHGPSDGHQSHLPYVVLRTAGRRKERFHKALIVVRVQGGATARLFVFHHPHHRSECRVPRTLVEGCAGRVGIQYGHQRGRRYTGNAHLCCCCLSRCRGVAGAGPSTLATPASAWAWARSFVPRRRATAGAPAETVPSPESTRSHDEVEGCETTTTNRRLAHRRGGLCRRVRCCVVPAAAAAALCCQEVCRAGAAGGGTRKRLLVPRAGRIVTNKDKGLHYNCLRSDGRKQAAAAQSPPLGSGGRTEVRILILRHIDDLQLAHSRTLALRVPFARNLSLFLPAYSRTVLARQ